MSHIGRSGPDRPQCADADKPSRFDRVGITDGKARQRPLSIYMLSVCLDGSKGGTIILAMRPDHIVGCVTAKGPIRKTSAPVGGLGVRLNSSCCTTSVRTRCRAVNRRPRRELSESFGACGMRQHVHPLLARNGDAGIAPRCPLLKG